MKLTNADYLHLDITAGISGDLFMAAALDAFPHLKSELEQLCGLLLPENQVPFELNQSLAFGVCASQLKLNLRSQSKQTSNYNELKQTIQALNTDNKIAQTAIELLDILAAAKSNIQCKKIDELVFDELPQLPFIFELLGTALIIQHFASASWSISDLTVNQGTMQTPAGPVLQPSPLVAELLTGFSFVPANHTKQYISEIGAVLLNYLKNKKAADCADKFQLTQIGYGVSYINADAYENSLADNHAVILRLMSYQKKAASLSPIPFSQTQPPQTQPSETYSQQTVILLSFDIDDMTAEELGWAIDKLRSDSKIIDITVNAVRGKKNRLVEQVQIVLELANLHSVTNDCFRLTTTIGLRWQYAERFCLSREQKIMQQNGVDIGVKLVSRPAQNSDIEQTIKVESDDLAHCQSLAERRKLKQQLE